MPNKQTSDLVQLKTWLFNKPALFALIFFGLNTVFSLIFSLFEMLVHVETMVPLYACMILSFIFSTYWMIKQLPHEKMSQSDFVAITNGAGILSISASFVTIFIISMYGATLQRKLMFFYLLHPYIFTVLFLLFLLVALYFVGVAISGIYAKYKRATTIGISPWKAILSMPFAFLLMWAPGYLNANKDKKSNLQIKCKWYNKFNKWVMSNINNILFMFLCLVLCKGLIAGFPTFVLSLVLLIIYTLWYAKYKSDFLKHINRGYALTAIGINLAILFAIISQIHIQLI